MKIELLLPIELIDSKFFILSFLVACLESFYQECLKPGMIFSAIGELVFKLQKKNGLSSKIAYILGYCPFCNGFYISFVVFVLYYNSINLTFILFSGLYFVFFRLLIIIYSYQH